MHKLLTIVSGSIKPYVTTPVLINLRFTATARLAGCFLHLQMCRYRIAGKFGRQKIWQIVLEVEKIKIWRNLNLANFCDVLSRIHKHAHISMRF